MLLLSETVTHQRDFLLNQRIEDLEAFEDTMASTRENLKNFEKQVDNAELKQLVSYVQDSLNDYHASVSQLAKIRIAAGLDLESGLSGNVRSALQELETSMIDLKDKTSSGQQALLNERLVSSILKMHQTSK